MSLSDMFNGVRITAYSHKVRKIMRNEHDTWLTGAPAAEFDAFTKLCFIGWAQGLPATDTAVLYVMACSALGRRPHDDKECGKTLAREGYQSIGTQLQHWEMVMLAAQ
jgi:hypothetical protein